MAGNRASGIVQLGLERGVGLAPGEYRGLIESASPVNRGNLLSVQKDGTATLRLNGLSALVVEGPR